MNYIPSRSRRTPPRHRCLILLLLLLCSGCRCNAPLDATLEVRDEAGDPVPDAQVLWSDGETSTNEQGRARLKDLGHPVMLQLSKEGFLDEPVAVGWDDQGEKVPVTLLSDLDGRRLVIHVAGDVMLGRRYVDPDGEDDEFQVGDGLIVPGDGGQSARDVVSDLAWAFTPAHLRTVNLETVVGRFEPEDAYPGKRWILQSDPDTLAALEAIGVDVAVLANNHQRDYLDIGCAATVEAAEDWGFAAVGGGEFAEQAEEAAIVERGGFRIGVLAFTSVEGDYVNEHYPRDEDTPPDDLDDDEAWQWEARSWGWEGEEVVVPVADRRIGSVWEIILETEQDLSTEEQGELWSSAAAVYPELQDWVARRGHGGGATWDSTHSPELVAALRDEVDILMVNLHSGYQFSSAPSSTVRDAAYACIDAGADLIVGHHPHVLLGVEYYDGKLIAWSLGNFIFDQDFLDTFRSAFLRTVWEDGSLLEARLIPLVIEGYRPVPVVDSAARYLLRKMWEGSLADTTARRGSDGKVRTELDPGEIVAGRAHAGFWMDRHSVVLAPTVEEAQTTKATFSGGIADLSGVEGLVWLPLLDVPDDKLEVGRSLFEWGDFEDKDTDLRVDDGTHWDLDPEFKKIVDDRSWDGRWCLEMERSTTNQSDVLARPVARVTLTGHRFWRDEQSPADGDASYSVRLAAWAKGDRGLAMVRLNMYYFDDTDPTIAPISKLIRQVELPIDVPADRGWHEVWLDLTDEDLAPDASGDIVGAVMIYVMMEPAEKKDTTMCFDGLEFVEWRPSAEQPEVWGAVDWIRSERSAQTALQVSTLPW